MCSPRGARPGANPVMPFCAEPAGASELRLTRAERPSLTRPQGADEDASPRSAACWRSGWGVAVQKLRCQSSVCPRALSLSLNVCLRKAHFRGGPDSKTCRF